MFLFLFFNSCSDHVSALLTNFPQLFMAYQIRSNSSAWHSWPAINLQPVPNLFLQLQIITTSHQKAEPNQITHHFPILSLFSLSDTNPSHNGKEEECQFYTGKGMRSLWNSITHIRKSSPKPLKKRNWFWARICPILLEKTAVLSFFLFFFFFSPHLRFS